MVKVVEIVLLKREIDLISKKVKKSYLPGSRLQSR